MSPETAADIFALASGVHPDSTQLLKNKPTEQQMLAATQSAHEGVDDACRVLRKFHGLSEIGGT